MSAPVPVALAISRRLPTPASQLVVAAVTATVAATVMRAGVSGAAPAIRARGDRRKHGRTRQGQMPAESGLVRLARQHASNIIDVFGKFD